MKLQWNKKYTTIAIYIGIVLTLGVLCVFFFMNLGSILAFLGKVLGVCASIFYGIVIAFFLNPIMMFYENHIFTSKKSGKVWRRTTRRILSVILTMITFAALLALFVWMIIPQLRASVTEFGNKLPSYVDSLRAWASELANGGGTIGNAIGTGLDYLNNFIDRSYDLLNDFLPKITNVIQSVATVFLDVVLGIIFAVYFLFSKEHITAQFRKLIRAIFREERYHSFCEVADLANNTFSRYFFGAIMDSVLVGFECFLMMSLFGMPYSPLISVVIGVTNIIPFFGPFIGAVPSALILFVARPIFAVYFAIGILVIQQIDGNIIAPRIHGASTGLSPVWVIVSITVTSGLFGVLGMFIGVPICSVIYVMIKKKVEDMLSAKGENVETIDYMDKTTRAHMEEENARIKKHKENNLSARIRRHFLGKKKEKNATDNNKTTSESNNVSTKK